MSHLDITTKQITVTATIIIVMIASEEPSGQLFAFPNITWIRFATIIPSDPPTNFGVIKSPVVGIKIIKDASTTFLINFLPDEVEIKKIKKKKTRIKR